MNAAYEAISKRKWLIYLVVFAALGLVFWQNDGHFRAEWDCLHEARRDLASHFQDGYMAMAPGRHYLGLTYSVLAQCVPGGKTVVSLGLWVLFFGSAYLLYRVLKQFFVPAAAFIGAFFYAFYVGRYEIFYGYSGILYLGVYVVFIVTLWLASLRDRSVWWRGLLMGLLVWVASHWYEILVTALPVYVLVMNGADWIERKRLRLKTFIASCIPGLVFVGHMFVLATATGSEIWKRSASAEGYAATPLTTKLWCGFVNALDATMGWLHFNKQVWQGLTSFFYYYILQKPVLGVLFVLAAWGFFQILKERFAEPHGAKGSQAMGHLWGLAGLYLLLFGGIITFLLGLEKAPPRMTSLPCIGLALLLAWLAHRFFAQKRSFGVRVLAYVLIGVWPLAELASFSSFTQQTLESSAFDQGMAKRIVTLSPDFPRDATIWVLSPQPKAARKIWRNFYSRFDGTLAPNNASVDVREALAGDFRFYRGANARLEAIKAGKLAPEDAETPHFNEIKCFSLSMNEKGTYGKAFLEMFKQWQGKSLENNYFFYGDKQWNLSAVKRVMLEDHEGKVLAEVSFKTPPAYKGPEPIELRVAAKTGLLVTTP